MIRLISCAKLSGTRRLITISFFSFVMPPNVIRCKTERKQKNTENTVVVFGAFGYLAGHGYVTDYVSLPGRIDEAGYGQGKSVRH
jgi:hypothetical protein